MSARYPLFVAVMLALAASSGAASAAEPNIAEQHYARGKALYAAGDYSGAVQAFDKAFELDAQPRYLYNRAQAERRYGGCEQAIHSYRMVIELSRSNEVRAKAANNIQVCRQILEQGGEGDREPGSLPAETPNETSRAAGPGEPPRKPAATASAEHGSGTPSPGQGPASGTATEDTSSAAPDQSGPRWYTDPWGGLLVGVGAVGVGVGVGLVVASANAEDEARDTELHAERSYADHVDEVDSVELQRTVGVVTLAAGSALLIGGIVRYIIVAQEPAPTESARHGFSCWAAAGAGCAWYRRF